MKSILLFLLLTITQILSAQSFTSVFDSPLEGVLGGSVAFSDIDGDNDNDLLITGQNISIERSTILYTNDGGIFTKVMDTPFEDVYLSAVAFSDVDGDGDEDLLITGENSLYEDIAKLYINDEGNFTENPDTPFDGASLGSSAFADIDGDGDDDLLITGINNSNEEVAKLYTNDGGNFTEVPDTPFDGVWLSSIAFSDVDSDGDEDLLISGKDSFFHTYC